MVYKQHYSQYAHYRTKKKLVIKCGLGQYFWQHMYFLIRYFEQQIYILSKSVKTISSRENPSRRRAGGKKGVPHCAFPWTNTHGEGVGLQGLDKQMTGNDRFWGNTSARPDANRRLWMWQPYYHLSFSTGGNSYGENALHLCHFEQTTPPNTR